MTEEKSANDRLLSQLYDEFGYIVVMTAVSPGEIILPSDCCRPLSIAFFITGKSNVEEATKQAHRACEIVGITPELIPLLPGTSYMRVQPLD